MNRSLVHEILQEVADFTARDVESLPPLHDTIDPDAVEKIGLCDAARLQFAYADSCVTVEVRSPRDWRVTIQTEYPETSA